MRGEAEPGREEHCLHSLVPSKGYKLTVQQIKFAKNKSDVAVKREGGDEKLEEWKKERLLEKRESSFYSVKREMRNGRQAVVD
jgi:hypothetical protein